MRRSDQNMISRNAADLRTDAVAQNRRKTDQVQSNDGRPKRRRSERQPRGRDVSSFFTTRGLGTPMPPETGSSGSGVITRIAAPTLRLAGWLSCQGCLFKELDLDVAEFDATALGFEPDVALGHVAIGPAIGHGSVDPERHFLAAAGDLERVPLAGGLDPAG